MDRLQPAVFAVLAALLLAASAAAQTPGYSPGRPFSAIQPARVASASPHGPLDIACEACHTADGWVPLRRTLDFDHDRQTGFALDGRHTQADCASCHLDLRFDQPEAGPDDCASCHLDVHGGDLGATCATCHNTTDFALVNGEAVHARTAFPLTGSHLQVDCATCHAQGAGGALGAPLGTLPTDCASCHAGDAAATAGGPVDHVASGFPSDCETCHSTVAFAGTPFDHAARADGFALVGAHLPLPCSACHTSTLEPIFDAAGQDDCLTCHADDAASASVDHARFPTTCTDCHSVNAWQGASGDHVVLSGGFPLVGAHLTLDCATCHTGPDYALPWTPAGPDDCQSCHADDASAATPSHAAFPTTCSTCHGTAAWAGATVDHPALANGFALVGTHASIPCSACHSNPDFSLPWTPANQDDCQSCHADDAAGATPSHAAFPTTCSTCHGTATWAGASIDHPAYSGGFALVGSHATIPCSACHSNPDFSLPWTPANQDDCQSCHADDAAGATPSHAAFPTTCATCHGTAMWAGATVDHPLLANGFALVGSHATIPCSACHSNPDFSLPWTPANQDDCQSCHADDAAGATPSHAAFPTTCSTCHGTATWAGASIDHPAYSGGFALVGSHATIPCSACHSNPDFSLPWTPANQDDCQSCHADDAAGATPSHVAFPTTCTTCHGTATWAGASVDHPTLSGGFALVGAHNALPCSACHSNPDFSLPWTPTSQDDCISCHATDYQAQHAGTGFPDTCQTCHTTSTWGGATFQHPQFPIYSGDHAGEWDTCQDCHTQPSNYQTFSCLTCHAHRQSEMDDEHDDVNGYVYSSPACYSCHPDGRDLTFGLTGSER